MPNENRPTRPQDNRPTQPDTGDKATDGAETDTHGNERERAPEREAPGSRR